MPTISDSAIQLLYKIGDIIRGDWSGMNFDGRDVKRWIEVALGMDEAEIVTLLVNLDKWCEEWYG